jgi:4-hydroxybenzoate polyprenyltransferase
MMTSQHWLSPRLAVTVAAVIAFAAFAVGQLLPGAGVAVVIAGSTTWVAYSVGRQRRHQRGA